MKSKIPTILIFLVFLYFLLISYYYFNFYLKNINNTALIIIYICLPLIISFTCFIFLFTKQNIKINFLVTLVTILILLFSINTYLSYQLDSITKEKYKIAKSKGLNYDLRNKIDVINEYKKDNINLYPAVYSNINYSSNFNIKGKKIHTLGGISNVDTIFCNEAGIWQIYKSDRFGFNNSDEIYENEKITIGIVGDSFLQGACVERKDTIGGQISKKFSKTLTIATSGSGSLTNLAFMMEYLSEKKPEIILWFFFAGNDLIEQKTEREQFDILHNYLKDKNFKQDLKLYQKEINDQLINVVNQQNPNNLKSQLRKYILFFAFDDLLEKFSSSIIKIFEKKQTDIKDQSNKIDIEYEKDFLIKILLHAQNVVNNWSGNLILVYLPHQKEMFENINNDSNIITNSVFKNLMIKNNIKFIDIVTRLEKEDNVRGLYALDLPISHFDEDGYKKISEIVMEELESKNLLKQ